MYIPSDIHEWVMPSPLYLVLLIAVLTWISFRVEKGARLKRYRWWLAGLLAWSWLGTTPIVANALLQWVEAGAVNEKRADQPMEKPLIAVLAAGNADTDASSVVDQLDLASIRRTLAGVEAWRSLGGRVVFVGSAFRTERFPVAERMRQLAIRVGMPGNVAETASGSLNTRENILQIRDRLEPGETLVLVTSAAHMRRALGTARSLGIAPVAYACDFRGKAKLDVRAWVPDNGAFTTMSYALYEVFGYTWYRLRGWVD